MRDVDVERRKRNRERMAKIRAQRKRKRRCRNCDKPVTVSPRTGRPARFCKKHLAAERARKTPPELPWTVPADQDPVRVWVAWPSDRPYPLRWLT
jgi:hypothetical protein